MFSVRLTLQCFECLLGWFGLLNLSWFIFFVFVAKYSQKSRATFQNILKSGCE